MKENKLRQFYKKHPKLRVAVDIVDSGSNLLTELGTCLMAVPIILLVILIYISLPEEINTPITVIVGGLLSAFAFPAIIEHLRVHHDQKLYMHQQNVKIEEDLMKLIIELINEGEQNKQRDIAKQISDFIAEHYYYYCLNYTHIQIDRLYLLKDECDMVYQHGSDSRASMDTLFRFAQKHLDIIRKNGYITGKALIDDWITEKIESNDGKN